MLVKSGNYLTLGDGVNEYYDKLPLGTYQLCQNQQSGQFFLEKANDFKVPEKLYGDFSIIDRWKKGYEEKIRQGKNLGILLTGIKGAGKTLTAKKLCIELNQPVILLTEAFSGPEFINFMSAPELGHCTIFIDEFEKHFRSSDQACEVTSFLNLLDGISATSHLYLMTVNNSSHMNQYLMNRPSRIHFRRDYDSLDESVIRDVARDRGLSEDEVEDLIDTCSELDEVSFDTVLSIINDCILYGELPSKSVKYMNFTRTNFRADIKTYIPENIEKFSTSISSSQEFKLNSIYKQFDVELLNRDFWIESFDITSDECYVEETRDRLECQLVQKDDESDTDFEKRLDSEAKKKLKVRYKDPKMLGSNFESKSVFSRPVNLAFLRKFYNKEKKIYIIPKDNEFNQIQKDVYIEITRIREKSKNSEISAFMD